LDSGLYENENGIFVPMPADVAHSRLLNDFDGDGDLDILAFDSESAVLYRNEEGAFSAFALAFDKPLVFANSDLDAARMGDFDNDGDEDVLVAVDDGSYGGFGAVYLFKNDRGVFATSGESRGPVYQIGTPAVADHDNDGDLDIVITGLDSYIYKAEGSSLLENTGSSFNLSDKDLPETSFGVPVWGDIDGDGDQDLVLSGGIYGIDGPAGIGGSHTLVLRNDGNSVFTQMAQIQPPVNGHAVLGDYDNDGDLDLFLSGTGLSTLYENRKTSFVNIAGAFDQLDVRHTALGDYDNDGDLDALITGLTEEGAVTRLFRNEQTNPNEAPGAPAGLNITIDGFSATFGWDAATDPETPAEGLSYNLRIGTQPGQDDVMAAHALENGARLLPGTGNAQQNTSWPLYDLPEGTYYWSVQAVDAGFRGSPFAEEQVLVLPDPAIPVELTRFDATSETDAVRLAWETESEVNNAGFEVQRAESPGNFERLAFIEGQGSTANPHVYEYTDTSLPFGALELRYRLKQIDFDGRFVYSSVITLNRDAPDAVALHPNYPNPFNPSTEIRFELPAGAEVRLVVYDLTGKEVAVLVDGFREAGRYRVAFDGSRLASGVYLYRLETPGRALMKRMVLIK
jgi:hypothetical protein